MTSIIQSPSTFFRQYWRGLILLVLPLLIALINPNWLYNPYELNKIDTWIYHSLFRYFPDFATAPHLSVFYFTERLSWILPGYALYHLFSPEIANAVLHLSVYYVALFSIYGVARRLFGQDSAFLMAICLGCYTWFLRAVGHDYLDGVGIAYYSAALWFATQAVFQRRYKRYLIACGAFLTLTIVTQLSWALFIPLVGLYYLVLNHKQNRHTLITSIAWVAFGIIGVMSVLMLVNISINGEWNIFKNSVMFLRATDKTSEATRDSALITYSKIPMTWLVLPCVVSLLGVFALIRRNYLTDTLRLYLILAVSGFAVTWMMFIFLHVTSVLPYLMIYLYISMSIPATFLLLAGLLSILGLKISTPYQAIMSLGIVLLPFLLVILFQPLENLTLNPIVVWPMTAMALGILLIGGIYRKNPLGVVSGFALMSFMLGGGNGISYHDRLQSYKIFVGVNDTIEAINHYHPTLEDVGSLMVWHQTTPVFKPYSGSVFNLYWGGTSWVMVQNAPHNLLFAADVTEDVVMLSDNPAILQQVQSVLDGLFSVEILTDFPIPSVDPTGTYRGYVMRLSRLDPYNEPIFPTGENIRKSRMDYTEFVPAVTGPESEVTLQFRLSTPTSDIQVSMCVSKIIVPVEEPLPAMLNNTPIAFILTDSDDSSDCEFTYVAEAPQSAINGESITEMLMDIPVGKIGASYEGLHIASITFTTVEP